MRMSINTLCLNNRDNSSTDSMIYAYNYVKSYYYLSYIPRKYANNITLGLCHMLQYRIISMSVKTQVQYIIED